MLSPQFFSNNRMKLRSSLPKDKLIIVTANGLMQRSGDTTYEFRQDSNFYYLTGILEPEIILVMQGETEFLIIPKRSQTEIIFGGKTDRDDLRKKSSIIKIYDFNEGWEVFKMLQKEQSGIYTLGAAPAKITGIDSFFTNPARRYLIQKIKRINPKQDLVDIRMDLATLRQIKQPEEIEALKNAIRITKQGFEKAKERVRDGAWEYEIQAEFDACFRNQNVSHGYQPIVAGGKNACVLHYIKNDQIMQNKDLLLLDVGAQYEGYSADISRTYAAYPSARQQEVIKAVRNVQDQAIAYLKAGVPWRSYTDYVEKVMGEQLMALGLIKTASREAIRDYFPHGVSHSLGLDVHDVCDYKIIEEHMVITVEPGIYIPEEGIGVRIEDNILITKTGAINLSDDIAY